MSGYIDKKTGQWVHHAMEGYSEKSEQHGSVLDDWLYATAHRALDPMALEGKITGRQPLEFGAETPADRGEHAAATVDAAEPASGGVVGGTVEPPSADEIVTTDHRPSRSARAARVVRAQPGEHAAATVPAGKAFEPERPTIPWETVTRRFGGHWSPGGLVIIGNETFVVGEPLPDEVPT